MRRHILASLLISSFCVCLLAQESGKTTKPFFEGGRPAKLAVSGGPPVSMATEGSNNNFFGGYAGFSNTTGACNSFFGAYAGYLNRNGYNNSFFGEESGSSNVGGYQNSFFGRYAGTANTTGYLNCFVGDSAGANNDTGNYNSAFGQNAGYWMSDEYFCTFLGYSSGATQSGHLLNATAVGANAYVTQSNSLVLGSITGVNDGSAYVNVGIGTTAPARQLHVAGPNAVFRIDRSTDTASFILVRTNAAGTLPWKSFVLGTNATGANQGEFIINDIGATVGGGGARRMTITNAGNVQFTGSVTAASFAETSSLAFKTNIQPVRNALDIVSRLRGVTYDWKDSGKPDVGLIAEEVDQVLPQIVTHDGGAASGVNYAKLVAVLVEAVKEQQKAHEEQQRTIERLKAEVEALKALLAH